MDRPEGFLDLEFKTRRALLWLAYLAIGGLVAVMIHYARPAISFILTILSPFIVALIVAYIFNPIVNVLQRRFNIGRISGVVLTYLLILLIVGGFFSLLVPVLYKQAKTGVTSIVANTPLVVDKATDWLSLKVTPEEMDQARDFFRRNFDLGDLSGGASTTVSRVTQQAFDTGRIVTRVIGTSISIIIGGIAFLTFVVVICFYFLLDYHRMEHIARVLLPDDKESRVFAIWARIDEALGGYLRGQLIVASIVGLIYTVVLFMMGMREYAILVGFLAGLGNMVPYAGPVIGGVPAGLWVLFGQTYDTGQEKLIGIGLIVALSIAVQSFDGLYMQPRIVGKNAELHPLLVLLALLIGAQFGIGGMIIAVPLAIMARVVLKELWWDPLERLEYESKRQAAAARMMPTGRKERMAEPRRKMMLAPSDEQAAEAPDVPGDVTPDPEVMVTKISVETETAMEADTEEEAPALERSKQAITEEAPQRKSRRRRRR